MYELDTVAGTVFSVSEGLAEAMAEALAFEHQQRVANLYDAVLMSSDAAEFFTPTLVAVA